MYFHGLNEMFLKHFLSVEIFLFPEKDGDDGNYYHKECDVLTVSVKISSQDVQYPSPASWTLTIGSNEIISHQNIFMALPGVSLSISFINNTLKVTSCAKSDFLHSFNIELH